MMFERVTGYLQERVAFLVESGSKSRIINVSAPRWIIGAAAGVLLLLLAGTVAFVAAGGLADNNLARLERKNRALIEEYRSLASTADSLDKLISFVEEHDIQIRVLNDMEILPADVRKLGVGGAVIESPEMVKLKEIASPNYEEIALISQGIDELFRRTDYQKESFTEIETQLKKNADLRDHIPSIVPTTGTYCGKFGYRTDPILGIRKMHCGVDISNLRGTPVIATADGVVSYAGWITGYGNVIKVNHGNCIQTVYAHLSEIYVEVGDKVSRYTLIGAMGATGRTVGTHLHYEVRVAGKAVNPEGYFLNGEDVLIQYPMP